MSGTKQKRKRKRLEYWFRTCGGRWARYRGCCWHMLPRYDRKVTKP